MRTAACASSPRCTGLCPFSAHRTIRQILHSALHVARIPSRRRRSFIPSTFTLRLDARDGPQAHPDLDTPLPVAHKCSPRVTRAHTTARRRSPASRAPRYRDGCAVPAPVRVRLISRLRTHPRRGKHRPILALHATHASPYIHTRVDPVHPRSHPASPLATPCLRVHRARWLPTVDSAYVNAPGHAADLRARVPAHNAARNIDTQHHRAAAARMTPRPTTRAARALRNSPRCISAHDSFQARHHRAAAAFSPAYDSPLHNLALACLRRPSHAHPVFPRRNPHRCISVRTIRAQRAALAPRAGHATGPA
ncbi:hypothetical protein C8R44DRAFT_895261 [Mycena epipterygia]|nr:hypothetical protein C8R44DRAFT_895261 [Mycena epipterygia]